MPRGIPPIWRPFGPRVPEFKPFTLVWISGALVGVGVGVGVGVFLVVLLRSLVPLLMKKY